VARRVQVEFVVVVGLVAATVLIALQSAKTTRPQSGAATQRSPAVPQAPPLPEGFRISVQLGDDLLSWVLQTHNIHRRTDSITFLGWDRIRRRVNLDLETPCSGPADLPVPGLGAPLQCIVPLIYVRKGYAEYEAALRDLDVRDDQERRLPVLGRDQQREAAMAVLGQAIWRMTTRALRPMEGPPLVLTRHEMEELWGMVASPLTVATRRCVDLERRIMGGDPNLPALVTAASESTNSLETLSFLMRMLSSHSLLLSDLGSQQAKATRRVVEIVYDDGHQVHGERWKVRSAAAAWRLLKLRLGLVGVDVDFDAWASLPCESHHFETEAPAQMIITQARTGVISRRQTSENPPACPLPVGVHAGSMVVCPTLKEIRRAVPGGATKPNSPSSRPRALATAGSSPSPTARRSTTSSTACSTSSENDGSAGRSLPHLSGGATAAGSDRSRPRAARL